MYIFLKTSFNANITNQSVDEILELIMHLGSLYNSDFDMDVNYNVKIHELLEAYFEGPYDVIDIMKTVRMQISQSMLCFKYNR